MRKAIGIVVLTAAAASCLAAPVSAAPTPGHGASLTRAVCDGGNQPTNGFECGSDLAVARHEGDGPTGVRHVDDAYIWLGELAGFYAKVGGDLQTMLAAPVEGVQAVNVSVRACADGRDCVNGAWPTYYSDRRVVFSHGLFSDDTFGHEFAHGVQDYYGVVESGKQGEVGAVREGVADVLGELFDLTNGTPDTTDRWKMGDGSVFGVYRDMDDPTLRRMPDRKGGQYWSTRGSPVINAAVIDKLGFLISEGQTFNGQTITGIGTARSAALWFAVVRNQPKGADFRAIAATLREVCASNARDGVAGTSNADCAQVEKAITATQLER
ncbi:M4 family metallopeptidase [Amycolatopsis cihanbeyliensis]|uniref:Thermolysin metallopeptidase-like protein n=1 Tax=Amycolatopsis cihanbeyliensis TaxID=1128664 RepID=A0A542DI39_AMYCI|nr:M4 family metallopeptidase [Amycolatopsis cihanbeyliensis]TQJ02762.1 thermolysin metallopeptidase-like protein [Amycolatopsis cihanbeyliensis]